MTISPKIIKKIKAPLVVLLFFSFNAIYACDSTAISKFSNGDKKLVAHYQNGQPCGIWKYYNEQKMVFKKEKYKDGIIVFTWLYNDKGRITSTINKKGKKREYEPCNCK